MEFLSVAGVVAIISGLISLVSFLIGQWFSFKQSYTNHYVEIITKQTLSNNMFVRENSEIVMTLTRPEIIDDANKNDDKEFKIKLMRAEVNLEHQFKYCFEREQKLINVLRKLVEEAFRYYNNPSQKNYDQLCSTSEDYYKMMTVYDYADWLYIKEQAKSKAYDKQPAKFDSIYEKVAPDFSDKKVPSRWRKL